MALVLIGATASASASAKGLDWAINGAPLAEGKSVSVKVEALTATTISSPEAGITFVCQKLSGKQTLVGGKEGTGTGSIKISKCAVSGEPKCKVPGSITYPDDPHPDYYLEKMGFNPNQTVSIRLGEEAIDPKVTKCAKEGSYVVAGLFDGLVSETNEQEFIDPISPLEASDVTVNGRPAVWSGSYRIKPPGKDTFGYAEL